MGIRERPSPRPHDAETPRDGKVLAERRSTWSFARLLVRHEDITRGHVWGGVRKHHTIIVNLRSGIEQFRAELDDGRRSVQPPTPGYMAIIPAGRAMSGRAAGARNGYAIWTMSTEGLARIAAEAGIKGPVELMPRLAQRDTTIQHAIRVLAGLEQTAGNLAELSAETVNQRLGLHLAATYDARHLQRRARAIPQILSRNAVAALQDHIDANLADKITLAELAAIAGETVHDLLLGFHQHFGVTPHRYIIEQRLHRVRWLLAQSSRPISQIAYETGFSSQSHMTTVFVGAFGATPAAYRRAAR